jgi:Rps23 Pro-64 3,4-dihydroxylase Tpa1-like proline 4-hydroxylase
MNLESYIRVYDNFLPLKNVSSLIKWSLTQSFSDAGIGSENTVDKNIRNVGSMCLIDFDNKSKTKTHWANYLGFLFQKMFNEYNREVAPFAGTSISAISAINLLKYDEGCHYKEHVDNFTANPRILSSILFLNDDYEGGELEFFEPTKKELIAKIEPQSSRLIIWPSDFLYVHKVNPVKKGKRFTVVSWAS